MNRKLFAVAASVAIALGLSSAAQAATVTYSNTNPDPKIQLTLEDVAPSNVRFSLATLFGQADFLGLGFNFSGAQIMQTAISLVSATRQDDTAITPVLQLFGDGTTPVTDCGPGCTFAGGGSASSFDYIIRIGSNGGGDGGNNYIKTAVFDIAGVGPLSPNPFSQFAIRAQATTGPSNSLKADLPPVAPVPLPAGLPLLGSGLLAMGMWLRRRKA